MITFKKQLALKDYDSVSLAEIIRAHFKDNYPSRVVHKMGDALQVASYLHRTDVRRGNRGKLPNPPYIEHPLRVAVRLFRYFGVTDPDTIIAAVLHDTVEDHPFEFSAFGEVPESTDEEQARARALEFISNNFGHAVSHIVELVSNPLLPEGTSKEEKVALYHQHVRGILVVSSRAAILKFSDFVDNAGSLHHHYEYSDPKATYFLNRYEPLIPIYANAFSLMGDFDARAAMDRLVDVQEQFTKFREAQA